MCEAERAYNIHLSGKRLAECLPIEQPARGGKVGQRELFLRTRHGILLGFFESFNILYPHRSETYGTLHRPQTSTQACTYLRCEWVTAQSRPRSVSSLAHRQHTSVFSDSVHRGSKNKSSVCTLMNVGPFRSITSKSSRHHQSQRCVDTPRGKPGKQ